MKKFLHLKRSIVDSKNQTTIVQAYLDTIRSSCYKLATPHASPRNSMNPSYMFQSSKPMAYQETDKKSQLFPFLSIKQSEEKPSFNQKKSNLNVQNFETTPQKQTVENQPFSNEHKIDQIFENLKSQCKSARQQQISEPEIMHIILSNLQVLGRKKQYQESVQLIRNIIMSMGKQQSKFTNIANHSQMKKLGYIVQDGGDDEQPENSFDCQHYKSLHPSSKGSRLNWDNHFMTQQPKVNQNHASTLSFSNSMASVSRNHEGSSIYIEDFPEQSLTPEKQSPIQNYSNIDNNPNHNDSNSMKSDSTNKFNQQSLSCIQEEQEQDIKSSDMSSVSVIPEQTIEFKKIIYMLDSNDTNKKSIQDAKLERSKSRSKKTSHSNSRNLFTEKSDDSSICRQQINRTYTQTFSDSSPESAKQIETYTDLLKQNTKPKAKQKIKQKQIKNTTVKICVNKKRKEVEQVEKIDKLGKTNPRKTKQLQDIVNMLSNKYNRTIKLGK